MEPSETRRSDGAGRFILSAVGLFLLAVLFARFTLDQTWGWAAAGVALPLLLLAVRFALGAWGPAVALVAFFAIAVLGLRSVLGNPRIGPALILLLGVFAISALLAGRVIVTLILLRRLPAQDQEAAPAEPQQGKV